jgi:glycosyltransferase involved in cell wall biosynthesis
VIKKRTDACFKLVGYGPELRNLEKLATTLGVNKNVEFTGPATKRELLELYNTSSVFVLPSLSEGFPNTVLEAMACGTPVIVTSGIGLEEVVATAGLYVPPREPVQLSDMILKILDNEEIAHELGHRARQRAEIYDWRGIVEQTNALYERIISSREAD